jgi:osmoprotectant transport system ATP-binding protein
MESELTPSCALEAQDVRKSYGSVAALAGVELRVEAGACVALVGESGSGKTTLLRCFNRTVEPDQGLVRIKGRDVLRLDPIRLRRETGFVQQEGGLLPHWSILRNAAMVPMLRDMEDAEDRARWALDLVGLPAKEYGDRWPTELSGGQRQRVAIARALASHPDVLLMDEPFGALDAITRTDLHETFAALRDRLGVTVLLVTHDLQEAFLLADRVAVMRDGTIHQLGAPGEIRGEPATAYVAQLVRRARVGEAT